VKSLQLNEITWDSSESLALSSCNYCCEAAIELEFVIFNIKRQIKSRMGQGNKRRLDETNYETPSHVTWAPVTTVWRALGLWMLETVSTHTHTHTQKVAGIILNMKSWTFDTEWSFSLRVGRGANNSSP
jgi:hypothetical protein